jgi:hypothetical protein
LVGAKIIKNGVLYNGDQKIRLVKNRTIIEYFLKTSSIPIGVSTNTTTAKLLKDYKHLLPDSKDISRKIDLLFRVNENSV